VPVVDPPVKMLPSPVVIFQAESIEGKEGDNCNCYRIRVHRKGWVGEKEDIWVAERERYNHNSLK